jgi:DNA-binding NtrC family response regulator
MRSLATHPDAEAEQLRASELATAWYKASMAAELARGGTDQLLLGAVEHVLGAALVLDAKLRVVHATQRAVELLGPVPPGTNAAAVLCGDSPKRPVAEALARGEAVQAVVPGARRGQGVSMLQVRALPFDGTGEAGALKPGRAPSGFVVLVSETEAPSSEGPILFHGMWTVDARMKELFRIIERVAADDVTVLVRGDTGAGKELVAQAVHQLSSRREGPFRAINCAALPPNLLESELFGHTKGAFTGAVRDAPGHFQLAHGGTLFLDEVAELPLELQAKLLRALETRTVLPVGGREPIPVDVRIVSATHRSLRKEVEAARFRADLMYRLRVIPLFLPPLRERPGDVRLLVERLIEETNRTHRRRIARISEVAMAALERHDWPGNVRELKNVLAYAYAIGDGPVLELSHLPPELSAPELGGRAPLVGADATLPQRADSPEARRILEALARSGQSRERAAQILGLSRVTLWRRMKALGLAKTRATD